MSEKWLKKWEYQENLEEIFSNKTDWNRGYL